MYLGGVPSFDLVSPYVPIRTGFKGCIQKLNINDEGRSLMGGALAGRNVSPCPGHPCSPWPPGSHPSAAAVCGAHGECVAREEMSIYHWSNIVHILGFYI